MEIYLKSNKTKDLMAKFIKQGKNTLEVTVWNLYVYSDFCQEIIVESSEIDYRLHHNTPIDKVASEWSKHWLASLSDKDEFEQHARTAVTNTHPLLFKVF